MKVPRWTRDATRPTAEETERLTRPLESELLAWARASTAPTDAERARLRPRTAPASGAPWVLVWGSAVAVSVMVAAGWLAHPETISIVAAPVEAGVYVVTPGIDVVPVEGVVVSGAGRVRLVPGALAAEGELRLAISSPVTVEHAGTRFTVRDARIGLGPHGLAVLEGEVQAPDGVVRAGERWPRPVTARLQVPSTSPGSAVVQLPAIERRPQPAEATPTEAAPAPAAPAEVSPAVRDATSEWRSVLETLEAGGPVEGRLARLDAYLVAWPRSPFRVEAEALRLLLGGARAAALDDVEGWLAANPGAPRSLELRALAARIAREELRDCVRARPHDRAVAAAGGDAGNRATALLGLCALSLGEDEEGRALLDAVDAGRLDPALRRAVIGAR